MGASALILANYDYKSLRIVVKHVQLIGPDELDLARYVGDPYLLKEMTRMAEGHLCGYVTTFHAVKDYEDVLDVHGGITFMTENADGSFTYGFDCAHGGDTLEYWNKDRVCQEAEDLARQILGLTQTN